MWLSTAGQAVKREVTAVKPEVAAGKQEVTAAKQGVAAVKRLGRLTPGAPDDLRGCFAQARLDHL